MIRFIYTPTRHHCDVTFSFDVIRRHVTFQTFFSDVIRRHHSFVCVSRTIQYLHRCLKTKDPLCHLGNEWRHTFQTFQTFHWEPKLRWYSWFPSTMDASRISNFLSIIQLSFHPSFKVWNFFICCNFSIQNNSNIW